MSKIYPNIMCSATQETIEGSSGADWLKNHV